tara:strand:+ start:86 stop:661 length:576 start_codon:yes stop_codon:yes gene_type:complete
MIFHSIDFELSDDDKQYIRDTYLTERFARKRYKKSQATEIKEYYTGYHHAPASQNRTGKPIQKFLDTRLLQIYSPILKRELTEQRLFEADRKGIYSYQHIWAQIYTKSLGKGIDAHHHYPDPSNLFSWIHFVDVPDEDCLYWEMNSGKKIYPQPQRSGKMIFFIPWTWHGVDPVESQEERIVVAGNVMRLK